MCYGEGGVVVEDLHEAASVVNMYLASKRRML